MDQLMIGYGVSNTSTANHMSSSMGFNISPITNSEPQNYVNINAPKKELSLVEKQQLANNLEKENGTATLKTSKSMADNFMNKNLADLTSLNNQPMLAITSNSSNKNNFDFFSEFETNSLAQHPQNKNTNNNNTFNKQNNFNGTFNANDHSSNGLNQFKNVSFNNSSQMQRSTSSQQGFFGNLALPAPPSMTSLMDTNKTKTTNIPNIAPPPLKPTQATTNLNKMNVSSSSNKKSALDDLNDLFG
jgi:hypothetical protein